MSEVSDVNMGVNLRGSHRARRSLPKILNCPPSKGSQDADCADIDVKIIIILYFILLIEILYEK